MKRETQKPPERKELPYRKNLPELSPAGNAWILGSEIFDQGQSESGLVPIIPWPSEEAKKEDEK